MTTEWRKSSRSSSQANGDCVVARATTRGFQIGDSKLGEESPVLDLDPKDFVSVLRAAQR
jgi:hypothetical protein